MNPRWWRWRWWWWWRRWRGIWRRRSLTSSESSHLLLQLTHCFNCEKKEEEDLLYRFLGFQIESGCVNNTLPFFLFLVTICFEICAFLPSRVENGGGQGESGQGRDCKSYTGIGRLTVHPETTTVASAADEYSTELTDFGADWFNSISRSPGHGGEKQENEHGDWYESGITNLPLSCCTVPIRFSTITNSTFPFPFPSTAFSFFGVGDLPFFFFFLTLV